MIAEGSLCAIQVILGGTNTGDLVTPTGTIPATGRPIRTAECGVFQVEQGKISRVALYSDSLSLLVRLGILPNSQDQVGQAGPGD